MPKQPAVDTLRDFTRLMMREVGIRCGDWDPRTDQERTWKRQGPCEPLFLDAVRAEVELMERTTPQKEPIYR